ncbi:MAG: rubredoxin [Halanaerobiaceae bacterium]
MFMNIRRGDMVPDMLNYKCTVCDYTYKSERGDKVHNIPPGTPFDDLPDGWRCPTFDILPVHSLTFTNEDSLKELTRLPND